jgi:hypothetical protein
MKADGNTLQGILDITPPAMPWQYAWESTWENHALSIIFASLLAITLLAVILHLIWRRYFSPRGKAQHQLRILSKQYCTHSISNKHAAFRLSQILRDTFNLTQLSTRTPLPNALETYQAQWQAFVDALSITRYSAKDDSQNQVGQLLTDAHFWLRHWPQE